MDLHTFTFMHGYILKISTGPVNPTVHKDNYLTYCNCTTIWDTLISTGNVWLGCSQDPTLRFEQLLKFIKD